jgi:hypothetical protein
MVPDRAGESSPRLPRGCEEIPVQISRRLLAHETILEEAQAMPRPAAEKLNRGQPQQFFREALCVIDY